MLPQLDGPALEPIEIAQALAMFLQQCGPQVTFFAMRPVTTSRCYFHFYLPDYSGDMLFPHLNFLNQSKFFKLYINARLPAVFDDITHSTMRKL